MTDPPDSSQLRGPLDSPGTAPYRRVLVLVLVAMVLVVGVLVAHDAWTGLETGLFVEAMVICSIVWVNFAFVFNYGYATSVVVLTITCLVVRGSSPVALVLGTLLVLYGVRLARFTFYRYRSVTYTGVSAMLRATHRSLPDSLTGFVWVQTALLMTFHAMAMVNLTTAGADFDAVAVVGVALVGLGLAVEAVADHQKQRAKAQDASTFVRTGLFTRTRHPNFLGEITFQAGVAVAGLSIVEAWYVQAAVVLGPFYIVVQSLSMVKRGETMKRSNYGRDPEFHEYVARSGALLPRLRP